VVDSFPVPDGVAVEQQHFPRRFYAESYFAVQQSSHRLLAVAILPEQVIEGHVLQFAYLDNVGVESSQVVELLVDDLLSAGEEFCLDDEVADGGPVGGLRGRRST
jgi:hypothetical protein